MKKISSSEDESQAAPPSVTWEEVKRDGGGALRSTCLVISPQKDGWNHVRPSAEILEASGIKVGDPIRFGLEKTEGGTNLIIERVEERPSLAAGPGLTHTASRFSIPSLRGPCRPGWREVRALPSATPQLPRGRS